jgi:predicted RNase H-like nuclease
MDDDRRLNPNLRPTTPACNSGNSGNSGNPARSVRRRVLSARASSILVQPERSALTRDRHREHAIAGDVKTDGRARAVATCFEASVG